MPPAKLRREPASADVGQGRQIGQRQQKLQINAQKLRYKSINYHFCVFISEEVAGVKRRNATKEVKKEERLSSSFFLVIDLIFRMVLP